MRTVQGGLGVVLALSLFGCAEDEAKREPAIDVDKLDFTSFDQALEGFVADNGLEGANAIVVHRDVGVIHQSAYGAFETDRISLIASTSKTISIGMLMHLQDQGLLDIDAPISDYLDGWGQSTKGDRTVAQLVSNSSGMVSLTDNPTYGPYFCQYLEAGTVSDCAQTIYTANDAADLGPADSEFHYGGGAWQLAGGIAEVVSGKSWMELFDEVYGRPCGLTSSGYTNQFQTAILAYPPYFDGDVADLPVTDNSSFEGGMYTNTSDYGRLLLMQLRGGNCANGRVMSPSAIETMQSDRIGEVYDGSTTNPEFPGYGLGWWVSRDEPGVVLDPGAYGAAAFIDNERGYAALIILEASSVGGSVTGVARPLLNAIIDDAAVTP